MRWFTPKGTIELTPVNMQDSQAVANADLMADAMSHFNDERFVEAMSICQTILRHHPDDAPALHLLGLVHYRNNNYLQARDLISQAIALNPETAHYHNNIGEVYSAMGNLEEATHHYEKAIALEPDFSIAHNNLANACAACGKNAAAIEHYEKAIAIKTDYAEAYRNLTLIEVPAPDDDKTANMQQLIDRPGTSDSDAMHLHFALGKVYEKAKQHDTAFEHYLKGNTLKRKTINFAMENYVNYADGLVNT